MPWRECIFTDTGVIYPPSWDMNSTGRDISASIVADDASLAATPKHRPSGLIATGWRSPPQLLEPHSCASLPPTPKGSYRIATQDLFARLTSSPESSAVPSLPRTDEHAVLPAATSPRTDEQQDFAMPEARGPPTCPKTATRLLRSHSAESWLAELNIELGEY
ncbi:hypothetical protein T484DRAFT_1951297 [Baffinella frigidus]|nr:hypothetical protein T484DRAFT_1951297 [Cryptophyta sp. CCMP2293]